VHFAAYCEEFDNIINLLFYSLLLYNKLIICEQEAIFRSAWIADNF